MHLSKLTYKVAAHLPGFRQETYFKHVHPFVTPRQVEITVNGDQSLRIAPRWDNVQRFLFLHGTYETFIQQWLTRELRPGMTVVEIGANIGFYALQICRSIGPSGKAVFVEPLPENYDLLVRNLSANGFSWAATRRAAVTAGEPEVTFFPSRDGAQSSLARHALADLPEIRVPGTSLDALFEAHGLAAVDLLLVDIEGAEAILPASGRRWFSEQRVRSVLLEPHPDKIAALGFKPEAFIEELRSLGYQVSFLDEKTGSEIPGHPGLEQRFQLVFRSSG